MKTPAASLIRFYINKFATQSKSTTSLGESIISMYNHSILDYISSFIATTSNVICVANFCKAHINTVSTH